MDWMTDVLRRLRNKNQILFSQDDEFLLDLKELMASLPHRALVLWALEAAEESVHALEVKYHGENRPRNALEAARMWAAGEIKMPIAKCAILDCHAFAKELSDAEDIALCHAVGQACSTVHTPRHAIGYPMYDLTSIVRRLGISDCRQSVEDRKQQYIHRLLYWGTHLVDHPGTWAGFLTEG